MNQTTSFPAFEEYMKELIEEFKLPGVSLGLSRDGQLLFEQSHGYYDVEHQLPNTVDTVFGIGSITKSMTSVAIMQLQEAGKLSVHDPVVTYLPEFRTPNDEWTKKITIHHFLTHTSGLPPLPTLVNALQRSLAADPTVINEKEIEEIRKHKPVDTYEELMDLIASLEITLLGEPGTEFSYSNESYALLGAIIQRVSGQTYEEYLKKHLLEPAGMNNSVFFPAELEQLMEVAPLYVRQAKDGVNEIVPAPIWLDAPAMRSAGFLKSTVRDMLKYMEIFRTGGMVGNKRILSRESVAEMVKAHIPIYKDSYYGYGLLVNPDYHGNTLIEHGGGLKGVAAWVYVIPEQGITGVVLSNLKGGPSKQLMLGLLNAIGERPVDASPVAYSEYPLRPDSLAEYVGEFRSGEGEKVSIQEGDGHLVTTIENRSFPLRCIEKDHFVFTRDRLDVWLRFFRNSSGRIDRIGFHYRQMMKV
ncbi:serine hydrolase [Brevibacillus reuszeri]|uniref:serine hydrolase domain-containing protein n=1 Tax=Brevibacillus reuszeri TaxID=54915 RepID=UPI001B16CEC7|nr:serine hydrolase [Brevibacillus reuszeri]GIO08050.1 serine hydrolase [Brevibacillus reuszeri]